MTCAGKIPKAGPGCVNFLFVVKSVCVEFLTVNVQKHTPTDNADLSAQMRSKGEEYDSAEAERNRVSQEVRKVEQSIKRLGEEVAKEVSVEHVDHTSQNIDTLPLQKYLKPMALDNEWSVCYSLCLLYTLCLVT